MGNYYRFAVTILGQGVICPSTSTGVKSWCRNDVQHNKVLPHSGEKFIVAGITIRRVMSTIPGITSEICIWEILVKIRCVFCGEMHIMITWNHRIRDACISNNSHRMHSICPFRSNSPVVGKVSQLCYKDYILGLGIIHYPLSLLVKYRWI